MLAPHALNAILVPELEPPVPSPLPPTTLTPMHPLLGNRVDSAVVSAGALYVP